MDMIFANPSGFWMLLGVPAVLAIHFLQNRAPRIAVSTLFLLDRLAEEEHRGSVWDRLRQSAALWLQLLVIFLLTLLLVRPMPLRSDSVQAIAIVLDNSVSMRAFMEPVREALERETGRLEERAATTEWFLQTTDPSRASLYHGTSRAALLASLQNWQPDSAEHDIQDALRRASELAGPGGLAILLTDHIPPSLPAGIAVLAVGEPLENVGFGSLVVASGTNGVHAWRATLHNHGSIAQRRELIFLRDGIAAAPEAIDLVPGQMRILRGEMPVGTGRMELRLTPADAFPLDDHLHILPPLRRILPAHVFLEDEALYEWAVRVMKVSSDVAWDAQPENAQILWVQPEGQERDAGLEGDAARAEVARIVVGTTGATASVVTGEIVAEDHPLTRDLSWQGLLCSVQQDLALAVGDEPLVWMAGHPLVFLRQHANGIRDLHLAFDLAASNAQRHPAVILLLHRFLESVRQRLPGAEAGIVELNQRLALPPSGMGSRELLIGLPGDPATAVAYPPHAAMHAPALPGFFEVQQGDKRLFTGAGVFTETREADCRMAASHNDLAKHTAEQIRLNRREDILFPLWLVLLGLAIPGSWLAALNKQSFNPSSKS